MILRTSGSLNNGIPAELYPSKPIIEEDVTMLMMAL